MDEFLNQYSCHYFHKAPKELIMELARFVVTTNYAHHCGVLPDFIDRDIQEVYNDEVHCASNSYFYVLKHNATQKIVGCIRIIKWNKECVLPMEKEFGIDVNKFVKEQLGRDDQVFHIGRFAVARNENARIFLHKTLLYNAACIICSAGKSITLAELDRKLFKTLRLFNIHFLQIGESKVELGSETIPAYIESENFIPFREKHKYLCYV